MTSSAKSNKKLFFLPFRLMIMQHTCETESYR